MREARDDRFQPRKLFSKLANQLHLKSAPFKLLRLLVDKKKKKNVSWIMSSSCISTNLFSPLLDTDVSCHISDLVKYVSEDIHPSRCLEEYPATRGFVSQGNVLDLSCTSLSLILYPLLHFNTYRIHVEKKRNCFSYEVTKVSFLSLPVGT